MKIRFTENGTSLIVLVIIIVTVGILGTGIVSFMGAKQKTYPFQAQTYQALNLANAGVEFAIRYANDQYVALGQSLQDSLGTERTVNFGNGSFRIQYFQTLDGKNYVLRSIGTSGNSIREVRVDKFAGYSYGGGLIPTPVVNNACQQPVQGCLDASCNIISCPGGGGSSNQRISLPVTNLFDVPVYVAYIEVTLDPAQGSANRIQELWYGGTQRYDYIDQLPQSDWSNPNSDGSGSNRGVCIPTSSGLGGCPSGSRNPAKIPYAFNLNLMIPSGAITQIIDFTSSSNAGTYVVKFYYDFDTNYNNLQTVTMTFTIT